VDQSRVSIRITDGKVHDVNVLDDLLIEAGAFYLIDRGYIDFERLYTLSKLLAFFVTRAKRNMAFRVLASRTVDKTTGLRFDQTIRLTGPVVSHDYPDTLRRIVSSILKRESGSFFSPTILIFRLKPSSNSTSVVGKSNSFSNGSNSI